MVQANVFADEVIFFRNVSREPDRDAIQLIAELCLCTELRFYHLGYLYSPETSRQAENWEKKCLP